MTEQQRRRRRRREQQIDWLTDHCVAGGCGTFIRAALCARTLPACIACPVSRRSTNARISPKGTLIRVWQRSEKWEAFLPVCSVCVCVRYTFILLLMKDSRKTLLLSLMTTFKNILTSGKHNITCHTRVPSHARGVWTSPYSQSIFPGFS